MFVAVCMFVAAGTQGECITSLLKLPVLSTGDMIRAEIAKMSTVGRKVKDIVASGHLVRADSYARHESSLLRAWCISSGCWPCPHSFVVVADATVHHMLVWEWSYCLQRCANLRLTA